MEKIWAFLSSKVAITDLIIIALAVALWIVLKKGTQKHTAKAAQNDKLFAKKETYISLALNIARYVILVVTILMVLQTSGVNVTSLIAGFGIASAIAGLAMQDLLKDFFMGSNIISNSFFVVGDVVKYNDVEGVVTAFSLRATKIRDIRTNDLVTVCNRNISEISVMSDWLDIVIPTPYDADHKTVRDALNELCREMTALPDVTDCQLLGTDELAGSSVNYRMRLFCKPELHPALRRTALGKIHDRLTERDITVPYQQIDIHSK